MCWNERQAAHADVGERTEREWRDSQPVTRGSHAGHTAPGTVVQATGATGSLALTHRQHLHLW